MFSWFISEGQGHVSYWVYPDKLNMYSPQIISRNPLNFGAFMLIGSNLDMMQASEHAAF